MFGTSFGAFSGIRQTLLAGFRAGDRAATEAVFELEGERSRRQSDYLDLYGLLGQFGALPAPE